MSFFGLTYLGSGNVFRNTRANKLDGLLAVPAEAFVDAFHQMSLERTRPKLAGEIGVDGVSFMMRGELPELMERVLGRVPEREELDVFLTFFDITATGVIDVREFEDGIARMRNRSEHPASSRTTALFRCSGTGRRTGGTGRIPRWRTPSPCSRRRSTAGSRIRRSRRRLGSGASIGVQKTDVTLNEGRSLQSYFGEM